MSKSCKLLFLIIISICATYIQAQESAVYNDINFILDPIKGTAEVTATPYISGDVLIPDEITVGQKTYQVVEIGENAFKGNKKLMNIVLPKGIQRIFRNAFDGTGIMQDKTKWNEGVLWIDSCLIATDKHIKPKYEVPSSTRIIACGAFEGNKTVTRVELPEGLKKIDHDTFKDCKNLTKVTIPSSVNWIGQDAFLNCGIYNNEKKWRKGALYIDGCLIAVNNNASAKFVFKDKVQILKFFLFCCCSKTLSSLLCYSKKIVIHR